MLVRQEGQRLCPDYSPRACQSASRHHDPPWTSANTVNGHGRHRRRVVNQTSPRALPPFRVRVGLILRCGGRMLVGKGMLDRSAQLLCINFEGALAHLSATFARLLHPTKEDIMLTMLRPLSLSAPTARPCQEDREAISQAAQGAKEPCQEGQGYRQEGSEYESARYGTSPRISNH